MVKICIKPKMRYYMEYFFSRLPQIKSIILEMKAIELCFSLLHSNLRPTIWDTAMVHVSLKLKRHEDIM